MKKLIVFAALGLGAFAVWRKVQSDRAELDLWTEATAAPHKTLSPVMNHAAGTSGRYGAPAGRAGWTSRFC